MKTLLIISLFALFAACGGDDASVPQTGAFATGTAPDGTDRDFAPTRRTEFPIGEKVRTFQGNAITVYSYESPVTRTSGSVAKAGFQYAVIDAEMCAGPSPRDGSFTANSTRFSVQMPNNTRRGEEGGVKSPGMPLTTLTANDCVRGYVGFEIPIGEKPRFIVYEELSFSDQVVIKWIAP